MTRRYFYSNQVAALWMKQQFGMELQFIDDDGKLCDWQRKWFYTCEPKPDKLYVHPDSLHLLEPQVGDLIKLKTPNDPFAFVFAIEAPELVVVNNGMLNHKYALTRLLERVVERNGIAFHWPESEEA